MHLGGARRGAGVEMALLPVGLGRVGAQIRCSGAVGEAMLVDQECLWEVVRDCQCVDGAQAEEQSRWKTPAGSFLQTRLLRMTALLSRDWNVEERCIR